MLSPEDEFQDDVPLVEKLVLQSRYDRRAIAYLTRLAGKLRIIEPTVFMDMLDDAEVAGQLTAAEFDDLRLTDLVLSGRRREDQTEVYLLVELAPSIKVQDVERAIRRACILEKLGRPVLPIVGGKRVAPEAAALARTSGVWQVLDGQTIAPN